MINLKNESGLSTVEVVEMNVMVETHEDKSVNDLS